MKNLIISYLKTNKTLKELKNKLKEGCRYSFFSLCDIIIMRCYLDMIINMGEN